MGSRSPAPVTYIPKTQAATVFQPVVPEKDFARAAARIQELKTEREAAKSRRYAEIGTPELSAVASTPEPAPEPTPAPAPASAPISKEQEIFLRNMRYRPGFRHGPIDTKNLKNYERSLLHMREKRGF